MIKKTEQQWVVLSSGCLPTEDIYFVEPFSSESNVRILSDSNIFRFFLIKLFFHRYLINSNVLVTRKLNPVWVRFLSRNHKLFKKIFYLVDDDLRASINDNSLPQDYRSRISNLALQNQPKILSIADEVVATSKMLASTLSNSHPCVSLLEPPLINQVPPLDHFEQSGVRIGYHGTRAHLQDLLHIAPALERIHNAFLQTRFEIMLGRNTPPSLSRLLRVSTPSPLSWPEFKRHQRTARIHIGLAPLLDTPYNRGKSHIKFLDIAAMGGVGVYSNRQPYSQIVEHGVDGLLVDDDPEAWYEALRMLVVNPSKARAMAAAAARKATVVGDTGRVVKFWNDRE